MKDCVGIFILAFILSNTLSAQPFEYMGNYLLQNADVDLFLGINTDRYPVAESDNNCQLRFQRNERNIFYIQTKGASLGVYREGGDGDYKLKFLTNKKDEWYFAEEFGELVIRHNKTGWYLVLNENNQPILSAVRNGSKDAWKVIQTSKKIDIASFHVPANDSKTFYKIELYYAYREGLPKGPLNEGFLQVPQDKSSSEVFLDNNDAGDAMYWALVRRGDVSSIVNKYNGKVLNLKDVGNGNYRAVMSTEQTSPWFTTCAQKDKWGFTFCGLSSSIKNGNTYEQVFLYPDKKRGLKAWKPGTFNAIQTRIWAPEKAVTQEFLNKWTAIPAKNSRK